MQVNDGIRIFRALSILARRYQFRNRDEVCCYGLTVSQCYALQVLFEDGPMPSSRLSDRLGLDFSSTTRLVDELVRKKLAVRRKGLEDARVREVAITESARKLIARIEEDFGQILAQAVADFPKAVQQAVPDVLLRLKHALETGSTFVPVEAIKLKT
ncbi:MAG: hypothetical protein C5B54_02285 [Acidobacteria bacterium]|nr:MAG: hypothetical protein C5B54_02285 [Acidobacteriota bacterium]